MIEAMPLMMSVVAASLVGTVMFLCGNSFARKYWYLYPLVGVFGYFIAKLAS